MERRFTLIELLVVVAIIGVLVSILMPSLGNARDKAQLAVCSSNQKNLGTAAYLNNKDHNRLPYAGYIQNYGDKDRARAVTFTSGSGQEITGWISATLEYTGETTRKDSKANHEADASDLNNIAILSCPSTNPEDYISAYQVRGSGHDIEGKAAYIANDAIYGREGSHRIDGIMDKIIEPSEVMLYTDGQGNDNGWTKYYSIYNKTFDQTMYDCFNQINAGRRSNFDMIRHKGKSAIVFADGHAKTIFLKTSYMLDIGISKGIEP